MLNVDTHANELRTQFYNHNDLRLWLANHSNLRPQFSYSTGSDNNTWQASKTRAHALAHAHSHRHAHTHTHTNAQGYTHTHAHTQGYRPTHIHTLTCCTYTHSLGVNSAHQRPQVAAHSFQCSLINHVHTHTLTWCQ